MEIVGQKLPLVCKLSLLSELEDLRQLKEGWNGYDALPPNPKAIDAAIDWLGTWYGALDRDPDPNIHPWEKPHATGSAEGEVVLEWWRGTKNLVVYIRPMNPNYDMDYLAEWGQDFDKGGHPYPLGSEDGQLSSEGDWLRLWNWMWDDEEDLP